MVRKTLVLLVIAMCIGAVLVPLTFAQDRPVNRTSWGQIKSLYRPTVNATADSSSRIGASRTSQPMNAQDRRAGPFPGGDWSSRVLWEARYALSRSANGSSSAPIYENAGKLKGFWGDWDYANSDPYALGKAKEEAFGYVGLLGPANGHYRGGWCTFFARLVLYRATYWAGYGWHLTMPNYPGGVYSWCNGCCMSQDYGSARPGWLAMAKDVHTAILEARAWDFGGWGWWVIDSNWTGGNGGYYISKHFMTDAQLRAGGYWVWNPTWATTN